MQSRIIEKPGFLVLLIAALVACKAGSDQYRGGVDWSNFDYRSSGQRDYDAGYQAPYSGPEDLDSGCTTDGINILCR